MLNVLTFRNGGNLLITGSVKVNGKQIDNPTDLSAMSAYVEQEDDFIGTLKVKEHLTFQVSCFRSYMEEIKIEITFIFNYSN